MRLCDKPEWRECRDAVRIADEIGVYAECGLPEGKICPFEEGDDNGFPQKQPHKSSG